MMIEPDSYGDVIEPDSNFRNFVKSLDELIHNDTVIIEGYCRLGCSSKVRSAKSVHKKTIGKRSWDHDTIYLFPELLIEQLKRQHHAEMFPNGFLKKNKLRKMLIREGLITRRIDGHIENQVQYKGVLVEAWPIDISELENTALNII